MYWHPVDTAGKTVMKMVSRTYSLNDIWDGLQDCYKDLKENVKKEYGVTLKHLDCHRILCDDAWLSAFDENDTILDSFRT